MDNSMKWNNKQTMSYDEADGLLERYYDGLTTGEEEKRLRLFLSQPNLPARYEPEQAIFGYFGTPKAKPVFSIRPYMRWVGGVAALLLLTVGLQWFVVQKTTDYAFVDGVKITDKQLVKRVAESSMKEMSCGTEGQSVKLDPKELMKQQLGAFSE
jgi:hypothetical protein